MPTGTTLANLRRMLNAETGEEMDETISPARVAINNQLLNNQQSFLYTQHGYLRGKARAELAATTGTQFYSIPTGIDFNQIEKPSYTKIANFRYKVGYGIGQEEYNIFRSDLGVRASPVMKWDLVNNGGNYQIELWPIPSVDQTIMFAGLLALTTMVNDSDTCVIDDLALVLYTAAEYLARKGSGDAGAKAAKAKAHMDTLKAAFPMKFERFNMAGANPRLAGFYRTNNQRPVVATNSGN